MIRNGLDRLVGMQRPNASALGHRMLARSKPGARTFCSAGSGGGDRGGASSSSRTIGCSAFARLEEMSGAELCIAFDSAVASNGPVIADLDDDLPEKLELDALYKQALRGDASEHVLGGRPAANADAQTHSKWAAWAQLHGTPKASAMRNFISRSNALYRDALEHQLKS